VSSAFAVEPRSHGWDTGKVRKHDAIRIPRACPFLLGATRNVTDCPCSDGRR
jgi:hypothetical protein